MRSSAPTSGPLARAGLSPARFGCRNSRRIRWDRRRSLRGQRPSSNQIQVPLFSVKLVLDRVGAGAICSDPEAAPAPVSTGKPLRTVSLRRCDRLSRPLQRGGTICRAHLPIRRPSRSRPGGRPGRSIRGRIPGCKASCRGASRPRPRAARRGLAHALCERTPLLA